jgi:hypothetical protein
MARLAVRFGGGKADRRAEFSIGLLGRLARRANGFLLRHALWERHYAQSKLEDWRIAGRKAPVSALRRNLNMQMADGELATILREIEKRRPCSLLIFGVGNDSILWHEANRGGHTVFLENDPFWQRVIRERHHDLEIVPVRYDTKARRWRDDLANPPPLDLPAEVTSRKWDLIFVDGPAAYTAESPGRVQSIAAASRLVAPDGTVMVHDCVRTAERTISDRLLSHLPVTSQMRSLRCFTGDGEAEEKDLRANGVELPSAHTG